MPTKESTLRLAFFDYLFDNQEGYICIATGIPVKGKRDRFDQSFFKWPAQKEEVTNYIDGEKSKNIWFGINLLDKPERKKEFCQPCNTIWADLDTCNPEDITPRPQCVIETSTDRYQAIWKIDEQLSPELAEEYSKRIYEKYKFKGVDSGWALTKLLRVPFTRNFKYGSKPKVILHRADPDKIDTSEFETIALEQLKQESGNDNTMPDLTELTDPDYILHEFRRSLNRVDFKNAMFNEPPSDWSVVLWQLINICLEVGMTMEETLSVTIQAKCNKYARDQRPISHLWIDIVKAANQNSAFNAIVGDLDEELINFPEIVNDDERSLIERSFLDDYIDWASDVTDASKEYHELCGAMLLSCMLADKLHVNTRSARVIPNLWGLVLGESTLTRKTTAMDMAMDFVMEQDPSLVLATLDSSVEGMFVALSERSNKVSIYYRDEVAGFFEAMTTKSYLAGMPEALTKLYDNPSVPMTRQLSKGPVTVSNPVFILFGGGILERVYSVVNQDLFFSGFMPRFLVVSGEVDMSKIEWIGPPGHMNGNNPREKLKTHLADFVEVYRSQSYKTTLLKQTVDKLKEVEVVLTPEAWEKMGMIERLLIMSANTSNLSLIALPTFSRMSTSILKLSMLIAASRQEPDSEFKITVELKDLLHAASLVQKWSVYTIDLMTNVGKTTSERELQRILKYIKEKPGDTRAHVMQRFRLQSLGAKIIFQTLEERGQIRLTQAGRGFRIYPA